MLDFKALAAGLAPLIKQLVGREVGVVAARVDALGLRVDALPTAKDGAHGRDGLDGKDGAPGKDGEKGLDGSDGAPGRDGIDGKDGAPGPKGADGLQGEKGERGEAGPAGADGRNGIDGKDGAPGADGARGDKGELGDRGPAGADGKDGVDGKDGAPGKDGINGANGAPGEKGLDGAPGRDGEDGRDALDLDVLLSIDETRRYRRGTYASYNGGLWKSVRTTEGMDGWECIVEGLAKLSVEQHVDNPRKFFVNIATTSGREQMKEFNLPVVLYRGIFKEGDFYEAGDSVTWGGSTWIALMDTKSKPDSADGTWRLSVKRGSPGKDGGPSK